MINRTFAISPIFLSFLNNISFLVKDVILSLNVILFIHIHIFEYFWSLNIKIFYWIIINSNQELFYIYNLIWIINLKVVFIIVYAPL